MKSRFQTAFLAATATAAAAMLASCGNSDGARANTTPVISQGVSVGVTKVARKTLDRQLTMSSELVPFQEIDVFAKEAGFVGKLNVDFGSRVKAGDVMAVLEIPELEQQLAQDDAMIKNAQTMIQHAEEELNRTEANAKVLQLEYDRLNSVATSRPGLVAQQEVDTAHGRDLAAQAQVEASKAILDSSQSQLQQAQARRQQHQVLFNYAKITAPFDGVVTQRYANFGTLMQAGTSSTNVLPLVRLSQNNLFRLVIPVPESFVRFIRIGDPVKVNVPAMNRTFPGKVTRFSVDVKEDTRTMHTEVDVPNPNGILLPGLYAEATLELERKENALAVPNQAVDRNGDNATADVIGPDNKIDVRQVVLGIQTATESEIVSGLREGEQVVVSDRSGLKLGQAVSPKEIELLRFQNQEHPGQEQKP